MEPFLVVSSSFFVTLSARSSLMISLTVCLPVERRNGSIVRPVGVLRGIHDGGKYCLNVGDRSAIDEGSIIS